MGRGGRGTRLAIVPLLSMVAIALSSRSALGNPIVPPYEIYVILIPYNLPINGLLLISMYALWVRFEGAPQPMGSGRFFELALECVFVITLYGSIIDLGVFYSANNQSFFLGSLVIAAMVGILARFVLRMSIRWSLIAGVAFFVVNILSWSILEGSGDLLVLIFVLTLFLVGFIVILARMAFFHHPITRPVVWDDNYIGDQGDMGPEGRVSGSYLESVDASIDLMRTLVAGSVVMIFLSMFFWV